MKHSPTHILGVAGLLLVVSWSGLWAQTPTLATQEPKTKIEAFEKQTGTVIIKGFSEIGSVSGLGTVSVQCVEFIDASSGQKQYGILIEVSQIGRFEREDRSFVDYDEIEPLIKGIDYVSNTTPHVTKLAQFEQFEAAYKTKGDLNVITFSSRSPGKIEAAVRSGYIGATSAYISTAKLAELRNLILQAKQKLDSIKSP